MRKEIHDRPQTEKTANLHKARMCLLPRQIIANRNEGRTSSGSIALFTCDMAEVGQEERDARIAMIETGICRLQFPSIFLHLSDSKPAERVATPNSQLAKMIANSTSRFDQPLIGDWTL